MICYECSISSKVLNIFVLLADHALPGKEDCENLTNYFMELILEDIEDDIPAFTGRAPVERQLRHEYSHITDKATYVVN